MPDHHNVLRMLRHVLHTFIRVDYSIRGIDLVLHHHHECDRGPGPGLCRDLDPDRGLDHDHGHLDRDPIRGQDLDHGHHLRDDVNALGVVVVEELDHVRLT